MRSFAVLRTVILVAGSLGAAPLWAGVVYSVDVTRVGEAYRVSIESRVEAPPAAVFALFTDYERLSRISPSIRESRIVARFDPWLHRVRTVTRLCVLIFCVDLIQVQDMAQYPPHEIVATVLPQYSNLSCGSGRWRIAGDGSATHLSFEAQLVPDFWVPPLIGPALLRHMLRKEAERTISGLERLSRSGRSAQGREPGGGEEKGPFAPGLAHLR
jgi:hypothetical protein